MKFMLSKRNFRMTFAMVQKCYYLNSTKALLYIRNFGVASCDGGVLVQSRPNLRWPSLSSR